MKNLFKPRITKFLKRTMCLTLAALFVVPSIMHSMPNDFLSAKALSSYEPVGVGKKLVDCFPGEDRLFAKYVYEKVLGKSDWDSKCGEYQLVDNDVQAIQNCTEIDMDMMDSDFAEDEQKCSDVTGIQNFTSLTHLNLSHNNITFLPELPAGLTFLSVSFNQLTSLPDKLPAGLTLLSVAGNRLSYLPELPAGLTKLSAFNNQFSSLPENLPAGLTNLDIPDNQLSYLPELPTGLTHLNVAGNRLSYLPELPAGLTFLNVSFNQFTSLPDKLPAGLILLSARSNKLSFLPKNLPSNLTWLNVSYNQLQALPDTLPESLTSLDAENNQFKELDLSNLENLSDVTVYGQKPEFEYIVAEDGNYKILDVPTEHVSDIRINGEAYNDYDNSGSIIVDILPISFTYNYNTGYKNVKMDVNGAFSN